MKQLAVCLPLAAAPCCGVLSEGIWGVLSWKKWENNKIIELVFIYLLNFAFKPNNFTNTYADTLPACSRPGLPWLEGSGVYTPQSSLEAEGPQKSI